MVAEPLSWQTEANDLNEVVSRQRRATLTVHFEGKRLFVLAHVGGLGSLQEAEQLVRSGLWLGFGEDAVAIRTHSAALRELSSYEGDDFGCWPDGADRNSLDAYIESLIPVRNFVALLPGDGDLRAVWWSIVECEIDADGRFAATTARRSGYIGKTGIDLAPAD